MEEELDAGRSQNEEPPTQASAAGQNTHREDHPTNTLPTSPNIEEKSLLDLISNKTFKAAEDPGPSHVGPRWITPFKKQCFVTLGVCMNMAAHGLVTGFAAVLIPQLRHHESTIRIDDDEGSWIASIVGFALVCGNLCVTPLMAAWGRRPASLVSAATMLGGWLAMPLAGSAAVLLLARFLQGVAMGMSATISPLLIGEYTSPSGRGAFLSLISLSIGVGVLLSHSLGSFLAWRTAAAANALLSVATLFVVAYSPESPSWLADRGRYAECRRVFRWLRPPSEEEELRKLIAASVASRRARERRQRPRGCGNRIKGAVARLVETFRKREFYKPVVIMIHIYTLCQWSGMLMLTAYVVDLLHEMVGEGPSVALHAIGLDSQRIATNAMAVLAIRRIRRRTVLFWTVSLNLVAVLASAAFVYVRRLGSAGSPSHPAAAMALTHLHMFSIASGVVPLPFIIAGEVLPLEFRSLAGGISVLFLSGNMFAYLKTVPWFLRSFGLDGAYCIYSLVVAYCGAVVYLLLPETKDRTLQDIEDEFRGYALSPEEVKSRQSLTPRTRQYSSVVF